jgi:hypothetical protein
MLQASDSEQEGRVPLVARQVTVLLQNLLLKMLVTLIKLL